MQLARQQGQAMVFSLLFMAVCLITLLILYNQGQLVKNRVQIENAADAAVYSQAKLAARNLNFIAYTNRAMVANEVSIGQMVALLSWAKHYKQVDGFVAKAYAFPLYSIPIAPPTPTTMSDILSAATLPWKLLGTAVEAPTRAVVEKWPTVISIFNGALGVFQKVFALSTLEAQIEMNLNVVEDHEFDPDNPELYTPAVGWYFFVQNTLLTYFGENISPDNLYTRVSGALDSSGDDADGHDLVADFLGDQLGTIDNMINDNTTGMQKKRANNSAGGQNSNMNTAENDADGDGAVAAYQRFAAIVNRNREAFTQDRHWDIGPPRATESLRLVLDVGIVKLTMQLDLGFWAGIKNDGGTAFVSDGTLETDQDLESLGWSSIDVTSFGIEIDIGLFVNLEVCILGGCSDWDLIDYDITIPIGLPVAGATHQVVTDKKYAKKLITDWGYPMMPSDIYGGDDGDPLNSGAFDLFHLAALGWGQASPRFTPGGMYGTRQAGAEKDVTDTYGGAPSFFSLGDSFQKSGVGYEYTIALAKSLDEVETTDSDTFGINTGDTADWDQDDIAYTRFDVQTHSRVEGSDISADYQELIWNDTRPMMTVSSAETYFANPMQRNADGSDEAASLFSPFWDARLKEPSAIAMLIATGELPWSQIFEGLSDNASANDIVDWVLHGIADRVVDVGVDNLVEKIEPPFSLLMEPVLQDVASQATDTALGQLPDLDEYLP